MTLLGQNEMRPSGGKPLRVRFTDGLARAAHSEGAERGFDELGIGARSLLEEREAPLADGL